MWSYETAGDVNTEDVFYTLTKNKELAKTLSKFADLYGYFCKHPPKNAKAIQTSVFMDKAGMIPFFNESMSAKIVQALKTTHNPKKYSVYVKERITRAKLKRGGQISPTHDESETLDNFIDYVINSFIEKADVLLRSVAPDSMVTTAEKIADIGPWIVDAPKRIIESLENNPYIGGPLLQVAIDMFLEIAPKFIMVEELAVTALSIPLLPIAGLGALVEAAGLFVGEAIGMLSFALALSKGKKGAAFLNFIQLLPVFGPLMRQMIVNSVHMYDKFQSERAILGKLPIIGPLIYAEPPSANISNGGRRNRTRKHRTHRQSKKVD